jgi:hypothetical protein
MTRCNIYRSDRKAETYLYLREDMEFDDLPEPLQASFGEPVLVMCLALSPDRKLSRVDTARVMESLEEQGYYLQLPPKRTVEEEIGRRFS